MPQDSKYSDTKSSKRTPFAVVEAYNTIRTNLLFLLSKQNCKTVTISSANEGEGKSTTAVNTAIAFSQLGSKTLVIDADLRKPTVHKKIHINNTKGLSSILVGFCDFEEAINHINPNFDVLTAGPTPPNPSEILGSAAFDELINSFKEKYEYIIIDTPPVNIVSDSLVVVPRTDGLVLVLESGKTQHEEFRHALSSIEFASLHLLGVIFNKADPKTSSKYKYKNKYRKYNYYSYNNNHSDKTNH